MSTNQKEQYIYEKLKTFCSYRERCSHEVKEKLTELKANELQKEQIINKLYKEDFINDERFAEVYARGKFFSNNWGKIKIEFHLNQFNIPKEYINKAFQAINESEYRSKLQQIIEKKYHENADINYKIRKNKTARYCIQKGFEPWLVWQILNDNF